MVGGQPATEDGIRAFVKHHLKIEDADEAESALKRIMREEVGDRDITPENGELEEKLTYGVNVVRRTAIGPYIANHMVHACFKQAASRLNVFIDLKRTKGDLSEACIVKAAGISALDPDRLDRIYAMNGNGPAKTEWENYSGNVISSRQGRRSIKHDSEYLPPGTKFEFQINMLNNGLLKLEDIKDCLALMMICGLGSCRSLGCGKFRIDEADVEMVTYKPENRKQKVSDSAVGLPK